MKFTVYIKTYLKISLYLDLLITKLPFYHYVIGHLLKKVVELDPELVLFLLSAPEFIEWRIPRESSLFIESIAPTMLLIFVSMTIPPCTISSNAICKTSQWKTKSNSHTFLKQRFSTWTNTCIRSRTPNSLSFSSTIKTKYKVA